MFKRILLIVVILTTLVYGSIAFADDVVAIAHVDGDRPCGLSAVIALLACVIRFRRR